VKKQSTRYLNLYLRKEDLQPVRQRKLQQRKQPYPTKPNRKPEDSCSLVFGTSNKRSITRAPIGPVSIADTALPLSEVRSTSRLRILCSVGKYYYRLSVLETVQRYRILFISLLSARSFLMKSEFSFRDDTLRQKNSLRDKGAIVPVELARTNSCRHFSL